MSQQETNTERDDETFLVVNEDIIENKEHVWRKRSNNKKGYVEVPLSSLNQKELQGALNTACAKELYYHNKTMVFTKLIEVIENEAEKRGISLEEYQTEFHKRKKLLKRQNVVS